MNFTYNNHEQDYLAFQLYTASKSDTFYTKMKNSRYFITFCSLIMALYFLVAKDWGMLAYFGLTTVVFFVFYPTYFRWRQKVHFTRFIHRHYKNLFGKQEIFEVIGKNISLENISGKGTIKNAEIEKIMETKHHFFIALKSGASLIIPKNQLDDPSIFFKQLKSLNINTIKEPNWQWGKGVFWQKE